MTAKRKLASTQAAQDHCTELLARRRARLWQWPAAAVLLALLEAGFLVWLAANFQYLHDCWGVMREMEMGALDVPPSQSLSTMIPFWVILGVIGYTFTIYLIMQFFSLERRYLLALGRAQSAAAGD